MPFVASAVVAAASALVMAAAFLVRNGGSESLSEFPLDDAWIHQVYARGLLQDGAPTYNPGAAETGFSSPLWMFALAPIAWLARVTGLSPVLPTKLLGVVFAATTAVALASLVRRFGGSRKAVLATPVLVAIQPAFAFGSVSGMEVPLTAASLAVAWACWCAERQKSAGVAFAAASLARPEVVVVTVALCAFELVSGASGTLGFRGRLRRAATLGLPSLVALGAWAAFNLRITGFALPNTYYVKSAQLAALPSRIGYFWTSVAFDEPLLGAALGAAAAAGLYVLTRRPETRRAAIALAATTTLAIVAIVATHTLQQRAGYTAQRYFHPFTIFASTFAVVGVDALVQRARRVAGPALVGVALAAAALASVGLPLVRARRSYAAHCDRIWRLHTRPALDVAASTPRGALIGVEAAGSARYHSGRRVLDLLGLNARDVAHADTPAAAHCVILREAPSFFLVPAEWLPLLAPDFELTPLVTYQAPRYSNKSVDRRVVLATATPRAAASTFCRALTGVGK